MSMALPTVDGTEAFTGCVSGVSSEELLAFFKFAAVVDALCAAAASCVNPILDTAMVTFLLVTVPRPS
jgi:hypothetical protein